MKRFALTTVAAMTAVLLAGCGGTPAGTAPAGQPSPATTDASGPFNATDVMFLQMLLAQHDPAGAILGMARSRALDPQVRMLAAAVDVTQAEERATMLRWLGQWRQPAAVGTGPEAHAAHGGLPATGSAEIEALREAAGTDFDRTFLNLLIGHQHQAVEYARMELAGGANQAARGLAERVDRSRTAQIKLMLELVGQPPPTAASAGLAEVADRPGNRSRVTL